MFLDVNVWKTYRHMGWSNSNSKLGGTCLQKRTNWAINKLIFIETTI